MFFGDEAVFKKHIENDHVITTVIHSHNRRTYSYDIKNVNASIAIFEAEAKVKREIDELERWSIESNCMGVITNSGLLVIFWCLICCIHFATK
ncbi:hypothetical protein A0J61_05190 [Choanephora cucurbitarum]|uniref:Uncharacterized protein n=1 Tax=Choanephora cucurbitarum TaxID=101091 RepID=A0A1C7NDC0_9FUNG|nr:hypothetical protein A0J61_05190 [Choanephora cucurbitarum]